MGHVFVIMGVGQSEILGGAQNRSQWPAMLADVEPEMADEVRALVRECRRQRGWCVVLPMDSVNERQIASDPAVKSYRRRLLGEWTISEDHDFGCP